jgi:SlyX protein
MLLMKEKFVMLGKQLDFYRQQQPTNDSDRPPHY